MLRRLLNTVIENVTQPIESVPYPCLFTKKETISLGWLSTYAPCFPVKASSIKIITEPEQFYSLLISGCQTANKRITLVSLYIGNGQLEKKLVESLNNNEHFKCNKLKINILLDYTRGSRFKDNSRVMLRPLLEKDNPNCNVSLYHTPVLRGLLKKLAPNRWNELFGLQHMKLYIFDNTLVISGANLSTDYFTNRQDRYFVIENKQLSDFYCKLVEKVQSFSLKIDRDDNIALNSDWKHNPYEGNKTDFVESAGDLIERFLFESKLQQNSYKQEGFDTWIFPTVQMGQLGIQQDAQITERILAEAPKGSKLEIATSYFNLTSQYMKTIIEKSNAKCDILMAHPEANGFLGAKGLAGGIPFAYSLIAKKFREQYEYKGQNFRINMFEYLKKGWTYHAKGLWYYAPESDLPCMTLVGSPNFGERSVRKDLETQICIVTENVELQQKLDEERQKLYELGLPAATNRPVPKWVNTFVFLFRSYF